MPKAGAKASLETALKLAEGVPAMDLGAKLHTLAQAKAGLISGGATFVNWDVVKAAPTVAGFPITINLLAVVITVLITWLCYIGIKESARVNSVMVVVKVIILLAVVGLGIKFISPGNWHPFVPHGWRGIQAGAAIIFFAFIGFDAVSTTAEECRNPGRDLPRGILGSLVICTVIYAAVALVVTGMLHYTKLGGIADPLAYIFTQHKMAGIAASSRPVTNFGGPAPGTGPEEVFAKLVKKPGDAEWVPWTSEEGQKVANITCPGNRTIPTSVYPPRVEDAPTSRAAGAAR